MIDDVDIQLLSLVLRSKTYARNVGSLRAESSRGSAEPPNLIQPLTRRIFRPREIDSRYATDYGLHAYSWWMQAGSVERGSGGMHAESLPTWTPTAVAHQLYTVADGESLKANLGGCV